jgi:hypothetical protein
MRARNLIPLAAAVLAGAVLLAGCGGGAGTSAGGAGGAGNSASGADTGTVTLAITDAPGDFLSYAVDVLRIELRRSNGTVVQALPATTRVDFVELANLTEVLGVATVPSGAYDEVRLLLDYGDAAIVVQDADGNPATAVPRDTDGNALAQLDVRLQLAERDRIVVARGGRYAFTIDFDLAASNVVSLAPPAVTVSPLLVAVAGFDAAREHRLRGLLDAVDTTTSRVTLTVRPHGNRAGRFGTATFAVDAETAYEIDGTTLAGSAGLAALAALADDTLVVASGMVVSGQLVADRVLAGSSVPGTATDVVHGVVIARSGDVLTVLGSRAGRGFDGRFVPRPVQVTAGAATGITASGRDTPATLSSLSVGSLVSAYGTLAAGDAEADALDATSGRIVLHVGELAGTVVATSPLALDLAYVNGVRPSALAFAGTGADAATDADPDAYEVDAAGLDLAHIASGDVVRVRGFATDFGAAPPDFRALSLIDIAHASAGADYSASWRRSGGTTTPFTAITASGLAPDLTGAVSDLHLHGIRRGGFDAEVDTIVPGDDGRGVFALHERGTRSVRVFRTFAEFVDALQATLDGTRAVVGLSAGGQYRAASQELVAHRVSVELLAAQAASAVQ